MKQVGALAIIRSGDPQFGQNIINDVVGREVRRLNAENSVLRDRRKEELRRKSREARKRYVWPMEPWWVRAWDVCMGTIVCLREWSKESARRDGRA